MNSIIDYFSQHHDQLLYAIAGLSLLLELGVLGMSGPLLFFALSCFITGVLVSVGVVSGWEMELLLVGVITVVSAILLWKPFKNYQNAKEAPNTSSDMIGRQLPVSQTITHDAGRVAYSGIEWQARLAADQQGSVVAGARAEVVAVDGSLLLVKAIESAP
ncbi:MAG: NfeD family protein [Gammaproteobacteria bacterium]|jgi:inner membrane protein|nr:NfeD family protein [Gammaproteobacteria bacterium]MBU2224476.1 NfeD family protein [Gammaproteobacteria bacterium]MBU2280223.1 NfeD family protein [Gammaproteobacteria bacterium]